MPTSVKPAEAKLARQVIETFEGELDLREYKDNYQEELRRVIDAKIAGQEMVAPEEEAPAKVVNLMDALRRSLDTVSAAKKKPAKARLQEPVAEAADAARTRACGRRRSQARPGLIEAEERRGGGRRAPAVPSATAPRDEGPWREPLPRFRRRPRARRRGRRGGNRSRGSVGDRVPSASAVVRSICEPDGTSARTAPTRAAPSSGQRRRRRGPRVQFARAGQGRLHVGHDVLVPDVLVELRFLHHPPRLRSRAAEHQAAPGRVQRVREVLNRLEARGIDGRHVPEPEDDDLRQPIEVAGDALELVGRAEQERPVDAEDGDVVRDVLVLEDVHAAAFDVLRRSRAPRSSCPRPAG